MTEEKKKAPGGRERGGFSFGDREGGGRGRGDREGGRGGKFGRKDGPGGGGASYRVVNELSAVEKAVTKADFAAMKEPLSAILRAIKPMRLDSIEKLDLGTRGKLITSLMRVQRMSRPAAAPAEAAPAPEAPPADAAPAEGATAPAEGAPAAAAPAAPAAPAVDPKISAFADAQFTVGLIWSAVNDADRAKAAFDNAGRQPTESDLAMPAAPPPSQARSDRPERGGDRNGRRGDRPERGDRKDRGPRTERPPRVERERPQPFVSSGDWQADVKKLEELGRTRDAARIHEKNASFADASRLYEAGGDVKSAFRTAVMAKNDEAYARLSAKLKPEEIVEGLERASAWEKLMEFHVARSDFESIARLYERANQFDQAGLAWERSGKLALARKAYERAKDFGASHRVRDLEVQKLIERGDRLGAATLQVGAGKRAEAVETLKPLPAPKAYHFMVKLKLAAEAEALAKDELGKAEAANNALQRARWLEITGKLQEAADLYLANDRKDKAGFVFEAMGELKKAAELLEAGGQLDRAQAVFTKLGDTANAERVKALPRPEKPKKADKADDGEEGQQVPPPPEAAAPSAPSATA